ncbi:MMPL family transporter [Streptomyces poriferorum]|uniref:MMPL family transporter n=1 Tax=Streptomyces poriferorum TaxID=2798799 RepID=A0ABY9IV24_9ACTN|nr:MULTISPECIES: MMPL family transporter [unclassified Streptomyces]MDP5313104.1 MMPL family transporter [Streptomyces sp. Alt4]WLQ57897.1 MMPL family transporter [Streptomyces sp. Alt2]
MRTRPVRMARWSARHPWRAIVGWFLFVLLCLGAGIAAGNNPATTKDFWVGEAGHAESMATDAGLQRRPTEHVLIRARSGPLDPERADAAARDLTARMDALPEVADVAPPVRSEDGTALRVTVVMKGAELDARKNVVPLLDRTAQVADAHPDLIVEETGSPAISKGVNDQRGEDLALSERLSLPVTLVILLIVFGSVVMAGVPLLLALSSIAATMGLAMLASHLMPDPGVGTNMILLMGLAVGVDYTLFYLKREREERSRAAGRLSSEALVELAAATAGRAVVVSGLAVIVCTATLYLATDVIFSSLATGTVLVVAVAVLSSLTVLPALLVKLGHRAERRAAKKSARRAERGAPVVTKTAKPENGRVFGALMRPARRHPAITLCVSVLVMLAVAAPALGLKLVDPGRDTFSRDIPAMQVYDRLITAFPELLVKHEVVTRGTPEQAPEVRKALTELGRTAQADPLFSRTGEPVVRTSADGRTSVLELAVPHPAPSDEAITSLDHLRDRYIPSTVGELTAVDTGVSGDVARGQDYVHHERSKLPLVIGFLLLLTLVTTAVVFRSVIVGLLGVVLNLLSAAAALGALVLVFQGTWAEGLLDFDSLGAIASRVPLFLFVLLFGLSMDYQVFVVSRIKEAMDHGMTAREAVLDGIDRSAKVVTSAALVMVTIFAAFVFLHLTEMKQMGFCLAVAVLLDAVVIRMMILPAALLLLGERAWRPLRRRPGSVPSAPADLPVPHVG